MTTIYFMVAAAAQTVGDSPADDFEDGNGDDLLVGGASNYLDGGAGRDTLIGGGSIDLTQGDTFNGGKGSSSVANDALFRRAA